MKKSQFHKSRYLFEGCRTTVFAFNRISLLQTLNMTLSNLAKTFIDDPLHSTKSFDEIKENINICIAKFNRIHNDFESKECQKNGPLVNKKFSRILLQAFFIFFIGAISIGYCIAVSRRSSLIGNFQEFNVGNITDSSIIGKFLRLKFMCSYIL